MSMSSITEIRTEVSRRVGMQKNLTDWSKYGDVTVTLLPDNKLHFAYNDATVKANRWNAFEKMCNGLIINASRQAQVVALPVSVALEYTHPSVYSGYRASIVKQVVEKMDGVPAIIYFDTDKMRWLTSRTTELQQQDSAIEYADEWLKSVRSQMERTVDYSTTLMVRILHPDYVSPVDYQTTGVFLTSARKMSERLVNYSYIKSISEALDMQIAPLHDKFNSASAAEVIESLNTIPFAGYEVTFHDDTVLTFTGKQFLSKQGE